MRSSWPIWALLGAGTLVSCNCEEGQGLARVSPKIVVSPESLDFGEVPIGATRRIRVVVENQGNADLELRGADVAPPFTAERQVEVLAPGSQAAVDVAFAPTTDQPISATLIIASSDPERPMVSVALSGRGGEGFLVVRPAEINFQNTLVGVSRQSEIVISNLGIAEVAGRLRTEGFSRPEHVALTPLARIDDVAPLTISPRGELQLDLDYRPLEIGDDSGHVFFETCGDRCGLDVVVRASASQAVIRLEPSFVDFGAVGIGQRSTKSVVVKNDGTQPVDVTQVSTSGGVELTAAATRSLPATVPPGGSLAINLEYTPNAATQFTGAVEVQTTDPAVPEASAGVAGRGEGPLFLVQPEALAFGVQRVAATHRRALLLINAGSAEVRVQDIRVSGANFALGQVPGLPARLRGGESLTAYVHFSPQALGEYAGTVVVNTDDPAHREVTVPLSGGLADRLCELNFSEPRVNFGLLPLGYTRQRSVTLTNAGTDVCVLQSGAFRAPVDPTITFTAGTFPVTLQPGAQTVLSFEYRPVDMSESKANFVITTGDPVFPERPLPLAGTAQGYVDIFALPNRLDFGTLMPGCVSTARSVRVFNAGTADATVESITLAPGATSELRLMSPMTPLPLNRGATTQFAVQYAPTALGSDRSEVEIAVRDLPYPIVVPVQGGAAMDPRITDRFEQTTTRKVDVLFVIDDSCSMQDEQVALANNFRSFIQHANSRNVEFQIGVTTTTLVPTPGKLVGPVLDNNTPNLATEFQRQVNVGVAGSGWEQGLEAMDQALKLAQRGTPPNASLLRPDAALFTAIISDEDDQSGLAPAYYANALGTMAPRGFLTAVISGQATGCFSATANADPSPRYEEFVNLSQGLSQSICGNWASVLNNLGTAAFGLSRAFVLTVPADVADPISVSINGSTVPTSEWMYEPMDNTIRFPSPPPEGSMITVEYTPRC